MNQSEQAIPMSTDIGDISILPPPSAVNRRKAPRLLLVPLVPSSSDTHQFSLQAAPRIVLPMGLTSRCTKPMPSLKAAMTQTLKDQLKTDE